MFCDVPEVVYSLGYASPATLYCLLRFGLLDNYVEMHKGKVLLRMGSKGKSSTLAKRVRSLVNFIGGHELFMFASSEEESLQKIRNRWEEKAPKILNRFIIWCIY